jgi:hypothetical protein
MAREAVCDELYSERVLIGIHFKIHALKAFEALVRADERSVEREACAKMVEELNEIGHSYGLENRIRDKGSYRDF